jgi:tRNA G18 (ribose-2'-O)-methylase SpoU
VNKEQHPQIRDKNQSYLILNNISKDANFGFLIRSANAFGAVPVVVGRKRYSRGGAAGNTCRTPVINYLTLKMAIEGLRDRGCLICGIEIMPNATAVTERPFQQSTAFIVGNEGEGLNTSQKSHCDFFTYIPQYGSAVSLNISVATGIVLQHYGAWANYKETERVGEKFRSQTV